jgi:hypothetical protein
MMSGPASKGDPHEVKTQVIACNLCNSGTVEPLCQCHFCADYWRLAKAFNNKESWNHE